MRTINEEGRSLIKRWESLKLRSYQDTGGVWTIGYGHTRNVRAGQTITVDQAETFLSSDLQEAERTVENLVTVSLTDNQFAALVSFVYNIGGTQFKNSTLLKRLNKGDYAAVPYELSKWVFDNGKRIQGLANRRAVEAGLWAKGNFVSSRTVPTEGKPVKKPDAVSTVGQTMSAGGAALLPVAATNEKIAIGVAVLIALGVVVTALGMYLQSRKESAYE